MNKELWLSLSPLDKQKRRAQFLKSGKKTQSVINLVYYEKLIHVYDLILGLLDNLKNIIQEHSNDREPIKISVLRIVALLLIEQRLIDEQINPDYHIPPIYFQKIIEINSTDEAFKGLNDFLRSYLDMFEIWPEKSKYEPLFLSK